MLDYFDFLFESIKDVKIYYSRAFADRLESIYNNTQFSEVKNLVRSLINCQDTTRYRSDVSFIDVTDKNDKISFIPIARLKRLYDEELPTGAIDFETWIWNNSQDREAGKLSVPFLKFRQEVGLGRFVTKIFRDVLKSTVSDSTLEKFINHYKSIHDFEKDATERIQLVSGEDIRKWYLVDNYSEVKGQLGSSCMRYEKCQSFLDIYVQNPEVCQLLILFGNPEKTKISARAIIWKLTNGETIMDRIYSVADYEQNLFKDYAKNQGWLHVGSFRGVKSIHLKESKFSEYPYMDNFCYINKDSGVLTNDDSVFGNPGWYQLQNTDGSFTADDSVWSEWHGEYLRRDDAIWCDDADSYVHVDEAIYLEYCDTWVSPNANVSYSRYHGQSYFTDDSVWSEIMSDSLYHESAEEIRINHHGDTDWVPDDLNPNQFVDVEIDGEEFRTLRKCTIFDPVNIKYYFLDTTIDGENIVKIIKNRIESVEVDKAKILENIANSPITERQVKSKFNQLQNMLDRYCGQFNEVQKVVKLFLYFYPKDFVSKRDLQMKRCSHSDMTDIKNKMLRKLNPEIIEKLGLPENYIQVIERLGPVVIYNLFCISYFFLEDVITDKAVLQMWYKHKLG